MPTKKARDGDDDTPAVQVRRFRVTNPRITYRKPYTKAGEKVDALKGTSISVKQIPLARCLEFVAAGDMEEING